MADIEGLSDAVENGNWSRAKHLLAIRVAQMIEKTESPRETKALAISLASLINECEEADVTDNYEDALLAQIIARSQAHRAELEDERNAAIERANSKDEGGNA